MFIVILGTSHGHLLLLNFSPLELYCLNDVIFQEMQNTCDLQPFYQKLAAFFGRQGKPALAWLSRWFAVKEAMYADSEFTTSRAALSSLFDQLSDSTDLGEGDAAFLKAVAYLEPLKMELQVLAQVLVQTADCYGQKRELAGCTNDIFQLKTVR